MTAATSTPTTAPPPTRPPAPPGLRLQLDPTRAGTGAVDGGWWPRSRDPDAELSGLIASLDASLGPITRVALNLDAWDTAPRRVAVDGRRVHVGWFRHLDAHTIGVTRALQDRMTLLVVPPQATTAAAEIAMAMAADAANSARPADILAAAGSAARTPPPCPLATPITTGVKQHDWWNRQVVQRQQGLRLHQARVRPRRVRARQRHPRRGSLDEGQAVEFDITQSQKGPQAVNVRPAATQQ